jgi:integrase
MRLEAAKRETKVWLTDDEVEDLRRATASLRDDLIIQLGAYVGLRAFEIPQVQPGGISTTSNGQYRLHVPGGKDTTGNGGKPRNAYLPDNVERDLQRYQNAENIAPKDPFIDLSTAGVRKVVDRTADQAAEMTSDDDFQKVSTHDLRRRFAQRLLVDEELNPRVVMAVGGWDSFAAIEPYLTEPTEDVIDSAFASADTLNN